MIKNILDLFFKRPSSQLAHQDKEELLARIQVLETQQQEMLSLNNQTPAQTDKDDYALTEKQRAFALSLIEKLSHYELGCNPSDLKVKDLNRLLAYSKFKNKGALVNLEKKGVLKKNVK